MGDPDYESLDAWFDWRPVERFLRRFASGFRCLPPDYAQDLLQEVRTKVFLHMSKCPSDDQHVLWWVLDIARNATLSAARRFSATRRGGWAEHIPLLEDLAATPAQAPTATLV